MHALRQRLRIQIASAAVIAVLFALSAQRTAVWGQTPAPATPATAPPIASTEAAPAEGSPQQAAVGGNLLRVMLDGGPLMWPILGSSFLLVVFTLERLVMLRRSRVVPRLFVDKFLEQVRGGQLVRESAVDLCERNGSPVARVFVGPLKKWGRPAVEVEQAVIDAGERVTHELRRYLRLFNGISSVAPLLGLLGTVLGMITSFNAIVNSNAMGKAEVLAGGIGESLLTTAGGLFVAIPAMIAYMYFQSRVETLVMEIDAVSQQLVELVSAEGLERETVGRSKKKAA